MDQSSVSLALHEGNPQEMGGIPSQSTSYLESILYVDRLVQERHNFIVNAESSHKVPVIWKAFYMSIE